MVKNILTTVLLMLGISFHAFTQGDLLITPTRVVFEGRKQSESIYLVNVGKEKATYSISFIQNDQTEEGGYTRVDPSAKDKMFADSYLRIYPRTVELEPGESQTIKLQCRRTPDMKDGEYRSHLYFRSEQNYEPLGEPKSDITKTVSVQLTPIFGISIPVIIRSGTVNASATLSDFKLQINPDTQPILNLTINRTGNMSVIGDLSVEYLQENEKYIEIGKLKKVAVYTNVNKRFVSISLNQTPEVNLENGKLRISYNSLSDTKKQEVFSTTEIVLQ